MMKKVFFAAFVLLIVMGFAACSNKQVPVSTVNLQLQNSVDSLLKQGMGEYGATEGMAIVVETSTGNLRAMVGLKENNGKLVSDTTLFSKARKTFLLEVHPCLLLLKQEMYRWTICLKLMPVLMLLGRIPSMTIIGERVDMGN